MIEQAMWPSLRGPVFQMSARDVAAVVRTKTEAMVLKSA